MRERRIAMVIGAAILCSISILVFLLLYLGNEEMVRRAPRISWIDLFVFTSAAMFFISETDIPDVIRKSAHLRALVRAWAVFYLILAFVFMLPSARFPGDVVYYLGTGALMIGLYAIGSLRRALKVGAGRSG